jgi:PAS domain S-box-containing protein
LVIALRLGQRLWTRTLRIRRLVDANIIGIFIWDIEGRIIEANDAFLRLVGYDHDDIVSGRIRWTELTPPEWRERDERVVAELRSTGSLQPFEKEYFRKDGSRVPVLIGVAAFEKGGNQGVAFVLDLTERKRAEQALRRSEDWLAQAQRLSHTGNWVFNPTTMRYLYWSDESYRIWGVDPLQGLPSRDNVWQRIHPDDRAGVWEAVQEALRQQRGFVAEFRIVLPDGTVKYLEATTHHEFSSLGAVVEAVSTQVDVTERKRAQEEHERLRQLESDLAHMNRLSMMGELAASLAHEIAQPIGAAHNNARAAMNFLDRSPPDSGQVREALACVVDDAGRAANILDRIRDQIKKAPPRKESVDLNQAINDVTALAQGAIIKNGVSVQTRFTEGLPHVQADCVQLQQVVLNLILNAVEAMSSVKKGARELSISTEKNQTGNVLVAVRDSGPGIDSEHIEQVFEAFYTTKSSGVGMGLSICRSIIEAHGGRLWAEANAPRGAVFQFTLPTESEFKDSLQAAHQAREPREDTM